MKNAQQTILNYTTKYISPYCNAFWDIGYTADGTSFNIQNSIPYKSQKTKATPETNRAKEFQRGTAGVPESGKEGETGLSESSDIGLGCGDHAFESPHSDQVYKKNRLKRRFFCVIKVLRWRNYLRLLLFFISLRIASSGAAATAPVSRKQATVSLII